jgi:1-deoxyxylulose-5-phosphate synthase
MEYVEIAVMPRAGPSSRGEKDRSKNSRAKTDEFAHKLYYEESDFAVVDRVGEFAAKRGVSNAQVALAWLLHQPGVTAPFIRASKPHHLDDTLAATTLMLEDA